MAGRRSGASTSFSSWTTVLYLLLVFVAPLAFLQANAQDEQSVLQEDLGTVIGIDLGTTYS